MAVPLRGIFAAMCTPFDKSGEQIDESRYLQHIDDMIDAGLHGLVLCSGTGEYAYLREDEKKRLIELGVKHVNGRVPTIAQTTALSTSDCIEKSKFAEQSGASAVMVLPPFLEAPGERGIIHHYESIANSISIPVVMYNVPEQSCVDITPDLYRKLLQIDGLDYIKDSSGDFTGLQKLTEQGGHVLCGIDSLAPWSLMQGCCGMIWGAANFMPHECAKLYDLISQTQYAEALELWESMKSICLWFGGNDHEVDYLTGIKAAARLSGRELGPCRRPLPPVSKAARQEMESALANLPVNAVKAGAAVDSSWPDTFPEPV